MDHWGDPWADADNHDNNDNDNGEATKRQHESTVTTAHAARDATRFSHATTTFSVPAPIVLNGFADDAGWGVQDDDGFGEWTTSTTKMHKEDFADGTAGAGVGRDAITAGWSDYNGIDTSESNPMQDGQGLSRDDTWTPNPDDMEEQKEVDNVVSESSDSADTVRAAGSLDRGGGVAASASMDDDDSTQASIPSSEVSQIEAGSESPRTSIDDDSAHVQTSPAAEGSKTSKRTVNNSPDVPPPQESEEVRSSNATSAPVKYAADKRSQSERSDGSNYTGTYVLDIELLAQLFPSSDSATALPETPPDPIHSVTTRKAWYRLTRKQTMREYEGGHDDNSYVRVTWKSSQIRTDVNNIVLKWANDDRAAGRGPGARASFYWDTQAPPEQKATYQPKEKPMVPVPALEPQSRKPVRPPATEILPTFDWSSPATARNPWEQGHQSEPSSKSRASIEHQTTTVVPAIDEQPSTPKMASTSPYTSHNHDTIYDGNPGRTQPVASSTADRRLEESTTDTVEDPGTTSTSTKAPSSASNQDPVEDEDDEWGEMVTSPTVPVFLEPETESATPPTKSYALSMPLKASRFVTPSSTKPRVISDGSKDASAIVRLKGTVSPTSARFNPSAYIPTSVEEGPIGPALLKRQSEQTRAQARKEVLAVQPMAQLDEIMIGSSAADDAASSKEQDVTDVPIEMIQEGTRTEPPAEQLHQATAARTENTPTSPPSDDPAASVPSSAQPPPSSTDWADADFSFFETTQPALSSAVAVPANSDHVAPARSSAEDVWSVFETPVLPKQEPVSTMPSSPPPAPIGSAQANAEAGANANAEVDEAELTIRRIVQGLPDLRYMLAR